MKWKLINSGSFSGQQNMDIDLLLAKSLSENEAFFRLYRWQPYCISIGAYQNEGEINVEKAKNDGIDLVKRPTGGRAILHAEEWTYCAAIPLSINLTPHEIYEKISLALVKGLILYNAEFDGKLFLENIQPNFPELLKKSSGILCFASTAKSEVNYNGKKLIGSAQRKLGNSVLQHGSILIGNYHRNLPKYLISPKETKEELEYELNDRTTEIETILNTKVDYNELGNNLIAGFEEEWGIKFYISPNSADEYLH